MRIAAARLGTALFGLPLLCGAAAASQEEQGDEARGVAVRSAEAAEMSAGYGGRHALIVGVDDYDDPALSDLKHAEADARGMARVLVENLGFMEEDVRLMLGKDATKDALEAALMDWACDKKRVSRQDLMVVFFAGHGVTRDLDSRGVRGYFVPVDARSDQRGSFLWSSLLGMRDLEDISEAIPAKHVLFVLDCCFGGLAVNRSAPPIAAGLKSRARQVLTAGSADQTVLDGGAGGHSVFTHTVLEAMRGAADLDGDKVVTFGELFNYVGRQVEARTGSKQTPQQANLPDHEGGCVALFAPGIEPGEQTIGTRLAALERNQDQQLKELEQLSDALLVKEMLEQESGLWPRRVHRIPAMTRWLGSARDVHSRLALHQDFLKRVRQEAYMRQVLAGILEEGAGTEPVWDEVDPLLRWKFETLDTLVTELALLEDKIAEVEARLTFTRDIEELSLIRERVSWDTAIAAIRADPRYGGLVMTPQLGLVPLGADPVTGLHEFWHVGTGDRPERDPVSGRWIVENETGVVLVLSPGGPFWMGSSPPDEGAANPDPHHRDPEAPVHEVELDPYLIGKYELTQGQWMSIAGENPSEFAPGEVHGDNRHTLTHPVEYVSWERCVEMMSRIELYLPTEAQWECAARAGTSTPWSCGEEFDDLVGHVNLADQAATRAGQKWPFSARFPELDDGWVFHAPVDSLEPNPHGLHHLHGNVWEFCLDTYDDYTVPVRAGDGLRESLGSKQRVLRGGSYRLDPANSRSALRFDVGKGAPDNSIGLRPARPVSLPADD